MPPDELTQLLDDVVVTAEGEIRLDPLLQRPEVQLLEPGDLLLGERVVGELDERWAAPEGETLAQRRRCPVGIARRELVAARVEQLPKAVEVELAGLDAEEVAVVAGKQDAFAGAVQGLSQPRDVHLDDLRGARRLLVRPELVDEVVARDDLVRVDEEQGEDTALLAAADVEHAVLVDDLERAQDPKVHVLPHVLEVSALS